jgi:GDP-L-fucose synthase
VKILVTGASGMVGRNLLADPRAGAHAIVQPSRRDLDLTDGAACHAYLARERPDLVIHLAALVGGIQANIDNPARFLSENLAMGVNLLGAARAAGVRRLINLGSSCMYPKDLAGLLSEDRLLSGPLEPTNEGYALAKIAAWKLCLAMNQETPSLRYVTLIPPNLYGLHDRYDPHWSHLIAAAILKIDTAVSAGRGEVEIWGDGLARREFLFAGDLADFVWRWHDRLDDLPETLNVGWGMDLTVTEYYEAIARCLGYDGVYIHDTQNPTGMRSKRLDVSVQSRLGWSPPTPLAKGIAIAVADYRSRRPTPPR